MTNVTVHPITSMLNYTTYIEALDGTCWYRGCGDESFCLTPSLYRHPTISDSSDLFKLEWQLVNRFVERSSVQSLRTDLNTLFIMQHYGVPTRLLDWTENPFVALFFALTEAQRNATKAAAVWILQPLLWNSKAVDIDPAPGILSPGNTELLNGWLPSPLPTNRKPEPVAVYPTYNNPRVAIQRGAFTLFGSSTKSMEQSYIDNSYPPDSLVKLVFSSNDISNIFHSLTKMGVTDSVIYPDLEGLARELKRQYGFRI